MLLLGVLLAVVTLVVSLLGAESGSWERIWPFLVGAAVFIGLMNFVASWQRGEDYVGDASLVRWLWRGRRGGRID